eukprot:768350-Hanusia_phi.AAC.4
MRTRGENGEANGTMMRSRWRISRERLTGKDVCEEGKVWDEERDESGEANYAESEEPRGKERTKRGEEKRRVKVSPTPPPPPPPPPPSSPPPASSFPYRRQFRGQTLSTSLGTSRALSSGSDAELDCERMLPLNHLQCWVDDDGKGEEEVYAETSFHEDDHGAAVEVEDDNLVDAAGALRAVRASAMKMMESWSWSCR